MSSQTATLASRWSEHQLLCFSGLDGPLEWGQALEAWLLPDRLGLACDGPAGIELSLLVVGADGRVWQRLPGAGDDSFTAWQACRLTGSHAALELLADDATLLVELGLAGEDLLRGCVRWTGGEATLILTLAADECRRVDAKGLVLENQQLRLVLEPAGDVVAVARDAVAAAVRGQGRGARHYLGEPASQCGLFKVPLRAGQPVQFGLAIGREKPAPTLLEPAALADWCAPPAAPAPSGLYERAQAKAVALLRGVAFGPQGNLGGRWLASQRPEQRSFNTFHAPFLALGAATFDGELAKDVMRSAIALQQANGQVPELAWPDGYTQVTPPPLLCWGFWQVYQQTRDLDLLALAAPRLKDYVKHPLVSRMLERTGSGRCQGGKFLSWGRGEGSGMDNSPRFDINEPFAAVDLTAYACSEIELIARIIEEVSPEHREAVHLGWMGEELSRETREYFWRADEGWFCDRYGDGDWVDVKTAAGLLPLFAGVASDAQATILVEGHLQDPAGFWTAAPLASLHASDPRFARNMWRGCAFPTVNLLAIHGLRRYGFDDEAARLRQATLDHLTTWFERTGTFWEFYDALDELSPAELARGRRHGALPEHAVTAAVFLHLLSEPADAAG